MLELSGAIISFSAGICAALLLVATQPWHGRLTSDPQRGVQKLHKVPTPRVGGLVVLIGALAGAWALPSMGAAFEGVGASLWGELGSGGAVWGGSGWGEPVWGLPLWGLVALGALPGFLAGLLEDLTKRISARWRLLATCLSGLLFAQITGYRITAVDIPGLDWLLGFWLPSMLLTAVAVGGIANAVNLIDGVNGLAAGTAIILFAAFALLAFRLEDLPLLLICLVMIGALTSFLLLNFPMAYLFLGDAGAYTLGYVLAVVAVMLPARHPSLSPLVGLLALSYPVIETLVSVNRRWMRRSAGGRARLAAPVPARARLGPVSLGPVSLGAVGPGHASLGPVGLGQASLTSSGLAPSSLTPTSLTSTGLTSNSLTSTRLTSTGRIGQPDRLHLHSLVYRDTARRLTAALGAPQLRNPLTAVLLWPLPLASAGMTLLFCTHSALVVFGLAVMLWFYLRLYRRVALLSGARLMPVYAAAIASGRRGRLRPARGFGRFGADALGEAYREKRTGQDLIAQNLSGETYRGRRVKKGL